MMREIAAEKAAEKAAAANNELETFLNKKPTSSNPKFLRTSHQVNGNGKYSYTFFLIVN